MTASRTHIYTGYLCFRMESNEELMNAAKPPRICLDSWVLFDTVQTDKILECTITGKCRIPQFDLKFMSMSM